MRFIQLMNGTEVNIDHIVRIEVVEVSADKSKSREQRFRKRVFWQEGQEIESGLAYVSQDFSNSFSGAIPALPGYSVIGIYENEAEADGFSIYSSPIVGWRIDEDEVTPLSIEKSGSIGNQQAILFPCGKKVVMLHEANFDSIDDYKKYAIDSYQRDVKIKEAAILRSAEAAKTS